MAKSPTRQTLARAQGNKDSVTIDISQCGLPEPRIVEGYEKLHPGAVGRILDMAEKEQCHDQEIERLQCRHYLRTNTMGMCFGFVLCFAALAGGIILILMDKNAQGWVALISALGLALLAFIKGGKSK